jgi:hypothetical protein
MVKKSTLKSVTGEVILELGTPRKCTLFSLYVISQNKRRTGIKTA